MTKFQKQFHCYNFVRIMGGAPKPLTEEEFRIRIYPHRIDYVPLFKYYVEIFNNPEAVVQKQLAEPDTFETMKDLKARIYGIVNVYLAYGTDNVKTYIDNVTTYL